MMEAFSGLGSVSKHKMLPNLIGKENADCLMVHSSQCGQRGQSLSLLSKGDKIESVRLWCIDSVLTPLFVWLASMEIDTLIIVLSETKIFNRSHNNRCVHCHGCDLLCAVGLKIQTGSSSKGIMIPAQDVVRCVTLMLDDVMKVMEFKYKFTNNSSNLLFSSQWPVPLIYEVY